MQPYRIMLRILPKLDNARMDEGVENNTEYLRTNRRYKQGP